MYYKKHQWKTISFLFLFSLFFNTKSRHFEWSYAKPIVCRISM